MRDTRQPDASDSAALAECETCPPLDLNRHLIKRPASTFFFRAEGDSMIGAGIHPGDILVVDRSLEARDKRIVIARINDRFTIKRLRIKEGRGFLVPENPAYATMEITDEIDFEVWGVVSAVIHDL